MKGFIYLCKKTFKPISRRQVAFTEKHIAKMVKKFRMFEAREDEEKIDEVGFAKVATIKDIRKDGHVLTPGRYASIKIGDNGIPFEKKMEEYSQQLRLLLKEEEELTKKVCEVFKALGWEI